MAAATANDDKMGIHAEFYAEIILTCRGQFDDPNFGNRLDDITNRLYTLAQGNTRPLVIDVRPWNSVRVTLKVSQETAEALHHLAQRRDPKLVDIGILSVQVDGGSIMRLDQDLDHTRTHQSSDPLSAAELVTAGENTNMQACCVTSSALHPVPDEQQKSDRNSNASWLQTVTDSNQLPCSQSSSANNRTSSGLYAKVSSAALNCRDYAWHPLEGRSRHSTPTTTAPSTGAPSAGAGAATASSCFWRQMSSDWRHNGMTTDPFQFSADDLLTRMLADVPTPKRRQKSRKESSSTDLCRADSLTSTANVTALKHPDSLACSVSSSLGCENYIKPEIVTDIKHKIGEPSSAYGSAVDFVSVQQQASADCQLNANSTFSPTACTKSAQLSDIHRAAHKNTDSTSSGRRNGSGQAKKRRRLNARTNQVDSCSEEAGSFRLEAAGRQSLPNSVLQYQSVVDNEHGRTGVPKPAFSMNVLQNMHHSSGDQLRPRSGHSDNESPAVALQKHCYQQTFASNDSYADLSQYAVHQVPVDVTRLSRCSSGNSSTIVTSAVSQFTANTRLKPVAAFNSMPFYSGSSQAGARLPGGELRHPCSHSISAAKMNVGNVGNVDTLDATSSALHGIAGVRHMSPTDTVHLPSGHSINGFHGPSASMHSYALDQPADKYSTSYMQSHSMLPFTASPHEPWTSSELDYLATCGADSGIASNTSLSVGSDHSENDRASTGTEMPVVESTCSFKRSPAASADAPLLSSSPVVSEYAVKKLVSTYAESVCGTFSDSCSAGMIQSDPSSVYADSRVASECARLEARQRFIQKSRQTPTVVSECPPAITCPSLPRRLSESVKRAMRGVGELPNPALASSACDIAPAKVVIRITKTRCNGGNEAKRSKCKEKWSVQPILKPLTPASAETSEVSPPVTGAADIDTRTVKQMNRLPVNRTTATVSSELLIGQASDCTTQLSQNSNSAELQAGVAADDSSATGFVVSCPQISDEGKSLPIKLTDNMKLGLEVNEHDAANMFALNTLRTGERQDSTTAACQSVSDVPD